MRTNIFVLLGMMFLPTCCSASVIEAGQRDGSGAIDFKQQSVSSDVKHVANWIMESRDNGKLPFAIIDKVNARVFVFDANGRLLGSDAALLGMGRGDRYDVASGNQKMSSIKPDDRITPAGRFVVSLQHDIHGKEVLLIDYNASIALHAVVKGTPAERRAERLNSLTAQDNRISYGCVNVPVKFYEKIVSPAFTKTNGVVYILPETSNAKTVFGF
jgi:hypothetical protein